ncbi:transfer protein [Streptomyces sp. XH2]|uniref:transfer protein n=1 Tax=Streptomyces sp. XH2 TaxID=3412483 RepID=UPI003C7AE8BC
MSGTLAVPGANEYEIDVVELELEVPPGGLINYDLRKLRSALGVLDPSCLTVETDGLRRAIITVYRTPPLANVRAPRPEELVMTPDGYITVGLYHDGRPARKRLYVPGSGAQRGAMFGTTGAGKSRALQLVLAAEKRSRICSWVADLKGGQSIPEARKNVDWYVTSPEEAILLLRAAVKVAEERMRRYAALGRSMFILGRPDPLLSVRIDEANRLLEKGAPYRDEATYLLKELGRTGRSVGVGEDLEAQAGHVDELGGSDTLRAFLKEGDIVLLRWSSSMMQALVADGLLPLGAQLAPIPRLDGPPVLKSRFDLDATDDEGSTTGGMAYLLGGPRPTALMRFFQVGTPGIVEGLDPVILDLYGHDEPERLERESWDAAGAAYQARGQGIPVQLITQVKQQADAKANGPKPTTAARVLKALEDGEPWAKDDILAALKNDGYGEVSPGGLTNTLVALKKADKVLSPEQGVYQLPQ